MEGIGGSKEKYQDSFMGSRGPWGIMWVGGGWAPSLPGHRIPTPCTGHGEALAVGKPPAVDGRLALQLNKASPGACLPSPRNKIFIRMYQACYKTQTSLMKNFCSEKQTPRLCGEGSRAGISPGDRKERHCRSVSTCCFLREQK